jgi:hypothetical protein
VTHYGKEIDVVPGEHVKFEIDEIEPPPPVHQPKGRAPNEIKPSRAPLDETGAFKEPEGQYAHQSGTNV